MKFVTLEMVKQHLRIDGEDEDALLGAYIDAASSAIKNYLNEASPYSVERDDDLNPKYNEDGTPIYELVDGDRVIDIVVATATLIQVGYLYRERDTNDGYLQGFLPTPVTALLYPLRTPAIG